MQILSRASDNKKISNIRFNIRDYSLEKRNFDVKQNKKKCHETFVLLYTSSTIQKVAEC